MRQERIRIAGCLPQGGYLAFGFRDELLEFGYSLRGSDAADKIFKDMQDNQVGRMFEVWPVFWVEKVGNLHLEEFCLHFRIDVFPEHSFLPSLAEKELQATVYMRVVLFHEFLVYDRMVLLHVEDVDWPQAFEAFGNIFSDADDKPDGRDVLGLLDEVFGPETFPAIEHDGFYYLVFVVEVRIERFLGNLEMVADVVHRTASQSIAEKDAGNSFDDFQRGAVGEHVLRVGMAWIVRSCTLPWRVVGVVSGHFIHGNVFWVNRFHVQKYAISGNQQNGILRNR